MSTLRYDGSRVSADAIGGGGITDAMYEELQPRLEAARDAVVEAWRDDSLGFLGCPDIDPQPFLDFAETVRSSDRFAHQVVIGIGGSSLGARAILESATEGLEGLETHFSENIDPVGFLRMLESIDLERTLFVVITKSGTTIETMSKFWFAFSKMKEIAGPHVGNHFVAITDPERGELRPIAKQHGFTTFVVPPNVGGRFSVLTAVGLVPLALAGYPVEELLEGARATRDRAVEAPVESNALLRNAADHYLLMDFGVSQTVMMVYSDLLYPLADWFCQLWGESLGKAKNRAGQTIETGLTPVKALGVVDQHSQIQLYAEGPRDKHVVFVEVEEFARDVEIPDDDGFPEALSHLTGKSMSQILAAELQGTRAALTDDGRPTSTWTMSRIEPRSVGAFILAWEFITAVMGELLDINAFDQPGVELGKKVAHGLLGREGFSRWAKLGAPAEDEPPAMPVD